MKRFGEAVAICITGSITAVTMAVAAWIVWKVLGGIFW